MHYNLDVNIYNDGAIESQTFKDLYFSRDGGLDEAKYVFIEGNNLSKRFGDTKEFSIVELGFGTGLNFLTTINLWKKHYQTGKVLNYISVEKFPLSIQQITDTLKHWPELEIDLLEYHYPQIPQSICQINLEKLGVKLTLIFKDIQDALKNIPHKIDAWFLDGFAPSKNPEMWTNNIFLYMAKLSNYNATFSTFTAASHVRKRLESAGFEVTKFKGFGKKREMLKGILKT